MAIVVTDVTKQGIYRAATGVINSLLPVSDTVAVLLVKGVADTAQAIYLPSGLTPKCYMLWRSGMQSATIDGVANASDDSIGFCDGTNEFSLHDRMDSEVDGYETNWSHSDATVMRRHQSSPQAGQPDMGFTHVSFGAGVINIKTTVDNTTDPDHWIIVKAWGGDEVENSLAWGQDDLRADTTATTITTGFDATLTFLATIDNSTPFATYDDVNRSAYNGDLSRSVGVLLNDGSQASMTRSADEEAESNPVAAAAYLSNTKCLASTKNNTLNWTLTGGGHTSTTFDLTPSASTSNAICMGLSIEFSSDITVALVDTTLPATSGNYAQTDVGGYSLDVSMFSINGVTAYDTLTEATRMGDIFASFNEKRIFCSTNTWIHGIAGWDAAGQGALSTTLDAWESQSASFSSVNIFDTTSYSIDSAGWDFVVSNWHTSVIKGFAVAIK